MPAEKAERPTPAMPSFLQEIALGDAPCGEITCGIGNKGLFVVFSKAHFISSHWFIVQGLVRVLTLSGIQE